MLHQQGGLQGHHHLFHHAPRAVFDFLQVGELGLHAGNRRIQPAIAATRRIQLGEIGLQPVLILRSP